MWDIAAGWYEAGGVLSVLAFATSSIVLWRQEFGRAEIKCALGPKIWLYHEESEYADRMLARVVVAITFTNASPRGGTVEKMVLSWRNTL